MSDSMSSITGGLEAILTGDISGINNAHEQRKRGGNTKWYEHFAGFGEHMASEGGGSERAEVSGDFWGGADTVTGRTAAFFAAMPGIGHAGKKAGELGARAYLAGGEALDSASNFAGDAINFAGEKLEDFGNLFGGEQKELKRVFNKPLLSYRDTSGGGSQPIAQSGEIDVEKLKQAGQGSLKAAGKALDTVKKWSPF